MNNRGQHLIEYALIAILVIFGIVFMGPYVLRSVNAHFKLWDDSIQDSFQEPLSQAPTNVVPTIPTNCSCTPFLATNSCGSDQVGSECPIGDCIWARDCTPGCGSIPTFECELDNTCCTTWTDSGNCGNVAIPSGITTPPTTPPPGITNDCYVTQEVYTNLCPNEPVECMQPTNGNCQLACKPTFTIAPGSSPNYTVCPGSDTGLTQSLPIYTVANEGDCTQHTNPITKRTSLPTKCLYYCNSPYIPNQWNTDCVLCPTTAYADLWMDDDAHIYPSDANGDNLSPNNPILSTNASVEYHDLWEGTNCPYNNDAYYVYDKKSNTTPPVFRLPLTPGIVNWFLVYVYNTHGTDFAISLKLETPAGESGGPGFYSGGNTQGVTAFPCLTQVSYPGETTIFKPHTDPSTSGAHVERTCCWIDLAGFKWQATSKYTPPGLLFMIDLTSPTWCQNIPQCIDTKTCSS